MADDGLNPGLHKNVSTIFEGVQIPGNDDTRKSKHVPAPAQSENTQSATAVAELPMQPSESVQEQPQEAATKKETAEPLKLSSNLQMTEQTSLQQFLGTIKDKLFAPKPGVNPTKQIAMTIMVPVLFIVMIVTFTKVLKKPVRTQNHLAANAASGNVTELLSKTDWELPELYPDTLRDPMRFGSVSGSQGQSGTPTISAIVYSKDRPTAVIDGQIIHVGDKIWGATVTKINRDSVEFKIKNKRWIQRVQ